MTHGTSNCERTSKQIWTRSVDVEPPAVEREVLRGPNRGLHGRRGSWLVIRPRSWGRAPLGGLHVRSVYARLVAPGREAVAPVGRSVSSCQAPVLIGEPSPNGGRSVLVFVGLRLDPRCSNVDVAALNV